MYKYEGKVSQLLKTKQTSLIQQKTKSIFETADNELDEKSQNYLRTIINLEERVQALVPRNNPHQRLMEHGIIPRSKYTLDVYLRITDLFSLGKSPDQIVDYLHETHSSLKQAKLSREFVKKALQLTTVALLPEMIRLVPDNGEWSLIIDGTVRTKEDNVLVVIAAYPLQDQLDSTPNLIPLVAIFLPSENTKDIRQILYDLKPRLPSLPKSIISDFQVGILDAIAEIFPEAISQGCHYHMIELITRVLIHPIIKIIKKKLRRVTKGLIRWSHHSIYGQQSESLVLVARSIKKVCTSNGGGFGENFMDFCRKLMELGEWAHNRKDLLHSDQNYRQLLKLLTNDVWKAITPHISQLEFVLKEFTKLRNYLTMQEYKTAVKNKNVKGNASTIPLDLLIQDWIKLGEISKHKFNERFKKSAKKLQNHYDLIIPAILDQTLPRTTSPLENLFSQIKHLLRKWSGTSQVLRSFEWAAQLAVISQSLKETKLFAKLLRDVTSYDWIETNIKLGKQLSKYRFQVRFANSVAKETPKGLVRMLDNLAIRDITS